MIEDLNDAVSKKRQLADAEAALEAFEAGVSRSDLVARLRSDNPLHPALWLGRVSLLAFTTFLLGALAWTAVVAFGVPVPAQLMTLLESNASLPGPVILCALAACSLAMAGAMRELSAEIGARRPLLKEESQVQQKLTSEVMRLRAAQKIEARKSQTPVPVGWAVSA